VRGIDEREVQPHRETKSVGAEDTFPFDLETVEEMIEELSKITTVVLDRLKKHQLKGRTVTLKIKYHDFKIITRSQSFSHMVDDAETIFTTAKQLLEQTDLEDKKIRLLGISISNFGEPSRPLKEDASDQLKLF
jgi:DNA polymerase-4